MLKQVLYWIFIFILPAGALSGRDIDLDKVYISDSSSFYSKLINLKLEAYQKAGSAVLAENVVFANWINGNDIIYIREFGSINLLYLYNKNTSTSREILRIPGAVVAMLPDSTGAYAHIKYLSLRKDSPVPDNHLLTVNLRNYKTKDRLTNNISVDFALSPEGSSIIFESPKGISEEFTETGLVRLLIPSSEYFTKIGGGKGNPTIALFSPDRRSCLLMNGSGGIYRSLLPRTKRSVSGLTSPAETFWINNDTLMFRTGHTGSYSVTVESLSDGKRNTLIRDSLNTNICMSPKAGMASFLNSQLIVLYNINTAAKNDTGLEGEDVFFSPDGSSFVSLFVGNLFLSRYNTVLEKKPSLAKHGRTVLETYRQVIADGEFINEYSQAYCTQKIKAYSDFIGANP